MENNALTANRDTVAGLAREAAAKAFRKKSATKSGGSPTVSKTPMAAVDPTTLESLMTSTKRSPLTEQRASTFASQHKSSSSTSIATPSLQENRKVQKSTSKKKKKKRKKKKIAKNATPALGMAFAFSNSISVKTALADACSTPPEVRKIREARAAAEAKEKAVLSENDKEKAFGQKNVKQGNKKDQHKDESFVPEKRATPKSSAKREKRQKKGKKASKITKTPGNYSARKSASKRKRSNVSVSFSGLMNMNLMKEATVTPPGAKAAMAAKLFEEHKDVANATPKNTSAKLLADSPQPPSFFRQSAASRRAPTPKSRNSKTSPRRRESTARRQRRSSRRLSGTNDIEEMDTAMRELRRAEFLAKKKREEEARLQAKVVDDKTKEKARLFIKKKELMKSPSKKAFEQENGIEAVIINSPKSSQKSPAPIRRRLSENYMLPMRRENGSPLAPQHSMTPEQYATDAALRARLQRHEQLCATPGAPAHFGGDFSDDSDNEEEVTLHDGTIKGPKSAPGRISPRLVEAVKRNNAAILMQRFIRGHSSRCRYRTLISERARAAEEAHLARMEQARQMQAVKEALASRKITGMMWSFVQRSKTAKEVHRRHSAAVSLQSIIRMLLASRFAQKMRQERNSELARLEQRQKICSKWEHIYRSYRSRIQKEIMCAIKSDYEAQLRRSVLEKQKYSAALSIQSCWRKISAKKRVAHIRAAEEQKTATELAAAARLACTPNFANARILIESFDEHPNGFIVYNIFATLPTIGGSLTTARMWARYSQIDALDATLRLSGFCNLPTMPPKTWCQSHSFGFLQRRKCQLEKYLQGLITRPDVAQSHEFRYFMRALRA